MKMSIVKSVLFLGLLFIFPFFCRAQEERIGLSLDKTIYSFNLLPGQRQEFVLNIKNIINQKQRVSLEIQDFYVGENNKTSFSADKNEMYGMKEWIKNNEEENNIWIMEPEEEKRVKFIIES